MRVIKMRMRVIKMRVIKMRVIKMRVIKMRVIKMRVIKMRTRVIKMSEGDQDGDEDDRETGGERSHLTNNFDICSHDTTLVEVD